MTLGQQRRTIAVSAMVVFTLGFLNAAQNDEPPSARFLIGVGFTYTFISLFADLGAGDFAAGFAILVLISAVIYEGEDIMGLLTRRAKGEVKPKNRRKKVRDGFTSSEGIDSLESASAPSSDFQKPSRLQRATRMQRVKKVRR